MGAIVVKAQNEFLVDAWLEGNLDCTGDSRWLGPHLAFLTTNVTRDEVILYFDSVLFEGLAV